MAAKIFNVRNAHTYGRKRPRDASQSQSPPTDVVGTATIADTQGEPLTDHQIEILEGRGINIELAIRMGWEKQKGTGNIQIPYFKNGQRVNCKTRSIEGDKVFYQVKGGEKCFYNFDILKDVGEHLLLITEGEMDCMIALQCGYMAVSVPDGAPAQQVGDMDSAKYTYLEGLPENINKIILATDSDNPGLNLLHDLGIRLGKHRCLWVKYPVGCKDLNDTFVKYGERGVKETIARAQYMKIEGLVKLSELPPLPIHPALDVGIDLFYNHFRLRVGDLSVFTGIPSYGKSSVANQIAFNMAYNHDWNICFASFEQPPQTEHRRALRTLYSQKPEWKQNEDELLKADNFIERKIEFIIPSDKEWTDMDWLMERMAAAVIRYDSKLIIIDPWNELDHMFENNMMTITQYTGICIKDLKRFAQKYQVHIMVIAHPAKMQRNKDGSYPIPTPYDISDSAHWYNKPDQIVVIHRNSPEETLIRFAKSRYHQILGNPGEIKLKFNVASYQYVKPTTGTDDTTQTILEI